jgi:hypothetical protein
LHTGGEWSIFRPEDAFFRELVGRKLDLSPFPYNGRPHAWEKTMNALMICVAAAALGIDVGWQRLPEGGMEYIIQLDPQTLEILRSGEPIQSDIPPNAGDVRSYRIVVGAQKLPRETPPAAEPSATQKPTEPNSADRKESQLGTPLELPFNPGGKLFPEQRADFVETKDTAPADKSATRTASDNQTDNPAKPWLPLTFTLLGLVASLSANVYLGWIIADLRGRWRRMQQTGTPTTGE